MDIHIDNRVPDVYDQHQLIETAIDRAYQEGMGRLDITVVEPQTCVDWIFTVRGPDGQQFQVVIDIADQVNYDRLMGIMMHKLRDVLAA